MGDADRGRRRRGMWAWGIAWVLALTSVIYIWSVFDSDQHADAPAVAAGTEARDLRRVDAYRAFVVSPGVSPGPSHEYTARGIEHLAEAIRAIDESHTVGGETLAEELKTFQQKADKLRANPSARDHADIVKDVFSSAVDMLARLQRTRRIESPDLRAKISALGELARDVDASEPLLRQQVRVRQFFEGSADALHRLTRGTSVAAARS